MQHQPKKIKIIYVINDLLLGGAQRVVLDIASKLDKNKFEVAVCVLKDYKKIKPDGKDIAYLYEAAQIKVLNLDGGRKFTLSNFKSLISFIKTENPDIVHCHLPLSILAGVAAGKIAGVKTIVAHEHNTYDHSPFKIKLLRKLVQPFITLTVCYTDIVEDELFKSKHIATTNFDFKTKSCTIFNGIDIEAIDATKINLNRIQKRKELTITDNEVLISSVGRLISWKGHENLIRSVPYILKKHQNFKIAIIGYGPDLEKLKNVAAELAVEDNVIFTGARSDVYELLNASDIFSLVLCYDSTVKTAEAIGVAGLEAMAAGLPVVVADYPSADKFVNNINGIKVPPHNPEALAQAISSLIEQPSKRLELGTQARLFIQKELSWNSLIQIYQKMYIILSS